MKKMNETKSYSTVLKGTDAAQDYNNNNSGIKRASKLVLLVPCTFGTISCSQCQFVVLWFFLHDFCFSEANFQIITDDEIKLENILIKIKDLIHNYILRETIVNETVKSLKDEKVFINQYLYSEILSIFHLSSLIS